MEIESALVAHPKVAEAAVVGKPHEIKGESVFAYVVLRGEFPTGPKAEAFTKVVALEEGSSPADVPKVDAGGSPAI